MRVTQPMPNGNSSEMRSDSPKEDVFNGGSASSAAPTGGACVNCVHCSFTPISQSDGRYRRPRSATSSSSAALVPSASCVLSAGSELSERRHGSRLSHCRLPSAASEPNLKVKNKLKNHLNTRKSPLTRKESAPPSIKHRVPETLGILAPPSGPYLSGPHFPPYFC